MCWPQPSLLHPGHFAVCQSMHASACLGTNINGTNMFVQWKMHVPAREPLLGCPQSVLQWMMAHPEVWVPAVFLDRLFSNKSIIWGVTSAVSLLGCLQVFFFRILSPYGQKVIHPFWLLYYFKLLVFITQSQEIKSLKSCKVLFENT